MTKLRRREPSSSTESVKTQIRKKRGNQEKDVRYLPTGSTLLNLCLSDQVDGGYVMGSMANIVGDSSAGKTFLLWTAFAEVANNPAFDDIIIVYDEPEAAFFMDIAKLFNMPSDRVVFERSRTVQDWLKNVVKYVSKGKPFLYGTDSFDAIGSQEELDRFEELMKKGKEKGSYKTEKPKAAGELFRVITNYLESTDSLMLVLSQTRDNIGATFGEKKTRSGGNALRFYSAHEYWLHIMGHIKRKTRDVGVDVRARVKKNKVTGKLRTVEFPILFDYGVDDIESCINFLLAEGEWSMAGSRIVTGDSLITDGNTSMLKSELIKAIEEDGLENLLRQRVQECWDSVEKEISTNRKPKYKTDRKE